MNPEQIIKDPDFLGLPNSEKIKVLSQVDPDFKGLPDQEKVKFVTSIGQQKPMVPEPTQASPGISGGFIDTASEGMPDYSPKKTMANLPASALNYGKTLVDAVKGTVLPPFETPRAIGELGAGGVQAALGNDEVTESRRKFDAAVNDYKKTYGSLEGFAEALENDPVRLMGDASALLMGGGQLMRGGGKVARLPGMVDAGKTLVKAGAKVEPLSAVMGGAGAAIKAIPNSFTRKMYESAAKFSTTLDDAERAKLTETAFKYGAEPSIKGVDKVNSLISNLENKIETFLGGEYDRVMPVDELFKDFDKLKKEYLSTSGTPVVDFKAIEKIETQIRQANEILQRERLSPKEAQNLKRKIYKDLTKEYKKFKNSPASKDAQKTVARAAKEYLEDIFPEIKGINAEMGELIELQEAIQRSANRITNRDVIGIGAPIKGTTGGVIGGPFGAFAGYTLGILDTPAVKSKIAVLVEKMKRRGVKIKPTSALVRLGLYNIGKSSAAGGEEIIPKTLKVGHITDDDLPELTRRLMNQD